MTKKQLSLPTRYQRIRLLGEGGLGKVFLVQDRIRDQRVALKILTTAEPFHSEQEFSILAQLDHPGFIRVFDYGLIDGITPFFTMEYFPGKKLSTKAGRVDSPLIASLLTQLCESLHHIHSRGFIHCDLKPGNILIGKGKEPPVKILDFGLAEKTGKAAQGIRGTIGYIAPEVLKNQAPTSQADLYSLGCILYELVSGVSPFPGDSELEVLKLHLHAAPPALELPQGIPEVYRELTESLLRKNPGDRPSSAEEILEALGAGGRPVTASPPGTPLPESAFIGREKETAVLLDLLDTFSKEGRGAVVWVEGDAGIGKSRLLSEFKTAAEIKGHRFLRIGSIPGVPAPFQPVRKLLGDLLHLVGDDPRAGALAAELPVWARAWLPAEMAGDADSGAPPVETSREEKFRIYEILTRLMAELLENGHAILHFDDTGRMDSQSIEFIRYAVPALTSSSLLLFPHRPEEDRTVEPLAVNKDRVHRIRLKPFHPEETVRFIASKLGTRSDLPSVLAEKIHVASGGNPFFAGEILQHLVQTGTLRRISRQWEVDGKSLKRLPLPQSIKEIIVKKIASLSPSGRRLLSLASVIGNRFDLDILNRFLPKKTAKTDLASMGELFQSRLLVRHGEALDCFIFPSTLIRETALAGRKDGKEEQKLHLGIALVLESRGGKMESTELEEIAHHFRAGGDKKEAIRVFAAAAKEYEKTFSLEQALGCLETARALEPAADRKIPILSHLGKIFLQAGSYTKAKQAFQEGLELCRQTGEANNARRKASLEETISLLEGLSLALGNLGDYGSALEKSGEALRLREEIGDRAGVAEGLAISGRFLAMKNEYDKALQTFRRSLAIGQELDLRRCMASSLINIGNVHYFQGNYTEALPCFREALSIAESAQDVRNTTAALDNLGIIYSYTRELEQAKECLERSLAINKKRGNVYGINSNYNILGKVCGDLGALEKALDFQRRSLETNIRIGDKYAAAVVYNNIGDTYRNLGDYQKARTHLSESLRLSTELKDDRHKALALCNLGQICIEEGKREEGRRCFEDSMDLARKLHSFAVEAESLIGLSQLWLEEGNVEMARQKIADARSMAQQLGDKAMEGICKRWESVALAATGQTGKALRMIGAVEKTFRELQIDFELGRSLYEKGKIQHQAGNYTDAQSAFNEAKELFLKIGTKHYLARTLLEKGKVKIWL